MPLTPGTRIGPYEIVGVLGAGGMGEVYRATDTNLKRAVAIKVLPESVATDRDRLARFQREAEVLASLNHPNIGAIYGLERSKGTTALVMELVEGLTLADRIAQGPIPVDEALPIGKQIAEALEAAHEQGIVHRDLKPANIKLRPDGTVKVLDFGLAKMSERLPVGDTDLTLAWPTTPPGWPTTTPGWPATGRVLLGTPPYMSPEQARGKSVDKRTDIWAFGCVLYEMLTGTRAFQGEDVPTTISEVLQQEPHFDALPAHTPRWVRHVLQLCLKKDARERIQAVGDVRLALHGAFDTTASHSPIPAATKHRKWILAVGAAVFAGFLIGRVGDWATAPIDVVAVNRFVSLIPENQEVRFPGQPVLAFSPDGRALVYNTAAGLMVQRLDELAPRVLPGTDEAVRNPVFSPDGQSVAFFAARSETLKRVDISGGAPVVIGPASLPFGASWNLNNEIIFGQRTGIFRVSAAGGTPELLVSAQDGETLLCPQLLPDGDTLLFTVTTGATSRRWDDARVVAQSLSSGRRTVLVEGGSDGRYLRTGHLVYALGTNVLGVKLDLGRLAIAGRPVPLVQGVSRANLSGAAHFTVAEDGTLAYLPAIDEQLKRLVWVDRDGRATSLTDRPADYRSPRISPDGRRVAVEMSLPGEQNRDIWIIDIQGGAPIRLTTENSIDSDPLWTPDAERIVFSSNRAGGANALYWIAADGASEPEVLTKATQNQGATSWSSMARRLVFYDVGGAYDLYTLTPGEAPVQFTTTQFREAGAVFSPDGRWLAYSSDEQGRPEIFVTPYPGPGARIAISTEGGRSPRWSANGRELFYRNGPQMMVVSVMYGPPMKVSAPSVLFQRGFVEETEGVGAHQYDVSPDGQKFLMIDPVNASASTGVRRQIILVQNWFEELKRLVPN